MSNNELIRKAFNDVCSAISNLEVAKHELADLRAKSEMVKLTSETLENASRNYEPSNDIHEAVFIQHEKAKEEFDQFVNSNTKESIKNQLNSAFNATSEAQSILKSI